MRGYFAVGVEGISKPMNLGAIMRTANAFGASFVFTINAANPIKQTYKADTSRTFESVPYYQWDTVGDIVLPKGCKLVGVELTEDAIDLPKFSHPKSAAYVLGRERGDLSQPMIQKCDYLVKIPTRFCVNVSVAAALVMYDRIVVHGKHNTPRPIMPG